MQLGIVPARMPPDGVQWWGPHRTPVGHEKRAGPSALPFLPDKRDHDTRTIGRHPPPR